MLTITWAPMSSSTQTRTFVNVFEFYCHPTEKYHINTVSAVTSSMFYILKRKHLKSERSLWKLLITGLYYLLMLLFTFPAVPTVGYGGSAVGSSGLC